MKLIDLNENIGRRWFFSFRKVLLVSTRFRGRRSGIGLLPIFSVLPFGLSEEEGEMGCCASTERSVTASRASRWRSTGIVAMRDCKLKVFPSEVIDLERSVRTLDLSHNKIVDIPVDINKLSNMQRLILADNLIERLPQNIGKLQSIKILILDGNHISSLPDELGLLVRLEKLSLSRNLLSSLPDTIGSLRNLSLLNVSNNKLKMLPESIGSCFSLEELQASGNSIEELPSSICNLIHLKSLCLNNNNLNQGIESRGVHWRNPHDQGSWKVGKNMENYLGSNSLDHVK